MVSDGEGGGDPNHARPPPNRAAKAKTSRWVITDGSNTSKKAQRGASSAGCCSFASSSSPSSAPPSPPPPPQQQQKVLRMRRRRRALLVSHGGERKDDGLQDLALPIGMSFAAILAQFLDKKKLGEKMSADHLSRICTSALKESITNIYGDRFECFVRNFEKSFSSTLRTLRLINEASNSEQEETSCSEISSSYDTAPIIETAECLMTFGVSQSNLPFNSIDNQIIPYGQANHQLDHVSQSTCSSQFNQSILSTFQKSVVEQTRSNDLKAFEISLMMKRLQLKQSQLDLNSYANMLEKIKISMGISKASFKEEKLKNQMQDTRYAELLRRCIDLLVTGLIIMCGFLAYGAYIYSYQRITDATSSCTSIPKESKAWWIPKPVATFSSGWHMLRCHVVVLTRMSFGLLMILAIAYSVFQRSSMALPTMPVTFILLLLGAACGVAGKLCVDTLGGDGFHWLVYWELLCFLHFFANVFPATSYHILYGPLSVSQEVKAVRLPYRLRRCAFYGLLVLILPTLSGLLPFASFHEWVAHFTENGLWRNEDAL